MIGGGGCRKADSAMILSWFLAVSASICMNLTGAAQMRIILGAVETNPQRRYPTFCGVALR
jgi:hypothetical protein